MTNEEINLKVAAIIGWVFVPAEEGHYGKMTYPKWRHPGGHEYVSESPPPYATDWAWCGPLVEKYKIYLECNRGWYAQVDAYYNLPGTHHDYDPPMKQDSPQRAICLAVIAAQPIPATLPPEAPVHDSDHN